MRIYRKFRRIKRYGAVFLVLMALAACTNKPTQNQTTASAQIQATEAAIQTQDLDVAEPEPVGSELASSITQTVPGNDISVTYIDIGQGDSILIQDNGQNMLIDTGYYSAYDSLVAELNAKNVDGIDVLVCTHPDADHIGSAGNIVSYYDVNVVYMPEFEADSKSYGYLMDAVQTFETPVIHPAAGDLIPFGTATYEVVGPLPGTDYEDPNAHSIIIRMTNGEDSFIFTGDATGQEMNDVLQSGLDISADVYKVAHHGSANEGCNDPAFVQAVNPIYAVISCGYGNDYGHPHVETMQLLQNMGCNVFRTDLQGTVTCISHGNKAYKWSTTPTTDYRNGNLLK